MYAWLWLLLLLWLLRLQLRRLRLLHLQGWLCWSIREESVKHITKPVCYADASRKYAWLRLLRLLLLRLWLWWLRLRLRLRRLGLLWLPVQGWLC
jgi:hypothetical protein